MDVKALENLRAAQGLLELRPPCPNAAISRAYYAVYLAGWFLLAQQGDDPPLVDGRRYWRHLDFGLRLLRATIVNDDGREFVEHLQSKRIQADYYPDEIEMNEATALTDEARAFLGIRGLRSS